MGPLGFAGIGAGVGGLLGLAKHELEDVPRAERKRKMLAALARVSPWSGIAADMSMLEDPSLFNAITSGMGMGAGMGQQFAGLGGGGGGGMTPNTPYSGQSGFGLMGRTTPGEVGRYGF